MAQFDPQDFIERYGRDQLDLWIDAEECERDLSTFLRRGWPNFVSAQYQHSWAIDAIADHLMALADGTIRKLLITVPPRCSKTSLAAIAFPAWLWALPQNPKYPLHGAKAEFLCIAYNTIRAQEDAVTSRRLISSDWYQQRWGHRFQIARDRDNSERFDTSVGGSRISTGILATVLGRGGNIKIIDDAMKPDEPESETVGPQIIRTYDEVLSSRENDPRIAAELLIAQRLGDGDLPGHVLSKYGADPQRGGFCHLMVPCEYDWQRHCVTVLGWQDPRGCYTDADGEQQILPGPQRKLMDGTSFWPERFTPEIIQQRKTAEGPFSWCTPAESPILMADLDLRPISAVRVGDMVAGFTMDTKGEEGRGFKRRRLTPTKVLSISKSMQLVVKVTLDSGEVIRCTPDHKWYTRRPDGKTHAAYNVAKVGRLLSRVCPPRHYALDTDAKGWSAAWVSGFYEGEGSVTIPPRPKGGHMRERACITFVQGCGQNLPICEALEGHLRVLDFDFGCRETQPDNAKWQRRRQYHLRGNSLPLAQKFLHVIKAQKWRDRLLRSAFGAHFIYTRERVVSIQPDSFEEVYGLETETGNYVVWGLASSNSSKYQQAPVPRGGGIIKADWWQLYTGDVFPTCSFVLVSVDTAHTKDEQNDESGVTVWGVFIHEDLGTTQPQLMLLDAWEGRLEFNRLVTKVGDLCKKHNADVCLIEGKANGIDVINEIRRLYGRREWTTVQFDPKGDKVARLTSVQSLFSGEYRVDPDTEKADWHGGLVWAPDRDYAQLVIDRVGAFTGGKMKALALIDTTSQALQWLRKNGQLLTREEHEADIEEDLMYKPALKPLYDV